MRKKVYMFDWDHNLVTMPSFISMERYDHDKGEWVEEDVNADKFKDVRDLPEYRLSTKVDNPYECFRSDRMFINDVYDVIDKWPDSKGPSFDKLKKCVLDGDDFCIITARGHTPFVFRIALLMLIHQTFTNEEKEKVSDQIGGIGRYLQNQEILPVSSEYSIKKTRVNEEDTIPYKKRVAFRQYIKEKQEELDNLKMFTHLSFGFSDDDEKNINIVKELIEDELKEHHPESHFVLYDTSNPDEVIKSKLTSKYEKTQD